ncbi:hypothetical protein EON65_48115 [archaeon]|nr:MAG: hypothetical protein EON65_48115 [archaeon]
MFISIISIAVPTVNQGLTTIVKTVPFPISFVRASERFARCAHFPIFPCAHFRFSIVVLICLPYFMPCYSLLRVIIIVLSPSSIGLGRHYRGSCVVTKFQASLHRFLTKPHLNASMKSTEPLENPQQPIKECQHDSKERLFVGIPFGRDSSSDPGFRSLYQADLVAEERAVRWIPTQNVHMTLRFIGEVSTNVTQVIQSRLRDVRSSDFVCDFYGVGYLPLRGAPPRVLYVGCKEASPVLLNLQRDVDRAVDAALALSADLSAVDIQLAVVDSEGKMCKRSEPAPTESEMNNIIPAALPATVVGAGELGARDVIVAIHDTQSEMKRDNIASDISTMPNTQGRHNLKKYNAPSFFSHVTIARLSRLPKPTLKAWAERNAEYASSSHYVDRFVLYRSKLGAGGAVYEEVESFALQRVMEISRHDNVI